MIYISSRFMSRGRKGEGATYDILFRQLPLHILHCLPSPLTHPLRIPHQPLLSPQNILQLHRPTFGGGPTHLGDFEFGAETVDGLGFGLGGVLLGRWGVRVRDGGGGTGGELDRHFGGGGGLRRGETEEALDDLHGRQKASMS